MAFARSAPKKDSTANLGFESRDYGIWPAH